MSTPEHGHPDGPRPTYLEPTIPYTVDPVQAYSAPPGPMGLIRFSTDGARLAAAGPAGLVRVFDLMLGGSEVVRVDVGMLVEDVYLGPDQSGVDQTLVCCESGIHAVTPDAGVRSVLEPDPGRVLALAGDGRSAIVAAPTEGAGPWTLPLAERVELASGNLADSFPRGPDDVYSRATAVRFAPGALTFAMTAHVYSYGSVYLYPAGATTGAALAVEEEYAAQLTGPAMVSDVAFSASGALVATVVGRRVRVYDAAASWARTATLPDDVQAILGLRGDDAALLARGAGGLAWYATDGGAQVGSWSGPSPVVVAGHAPSGRTAIGCSDGSVWVLEPTSTSALLLEETASAGHAVCALAYSPDGELIAIGDRAGLVRIVGPDLESPSDSLPRPAPARRPSESSVIW